MPDAPAPQSGRRRALQQPCPPMLAACPAPSVLEEPGPEPLLLPVDPAARELPWRRAASELSWHASWISSCSSNCLAASSSDELTPSSAPARILPVACCLLHIACCPPWSQGCSARPPIAADVWYKHLDGGFPVQGVRFGGSRIGPTTNSTFHLLSEAAAAAGCWRPARLTRGGCPQ
jgi:hypothetical protein